MWEPKEFLKKRGYEIIQSSQNAPPFLIKDKNGKIKAISSGAGSSVVKFGKNYYKIKRNG